MAVKMSNLNKSTNKEVENKATVQADLGNKSETVQNDKETDKKTEKKETQVKSDNAHIGGGKCVIEYIGNGIWIDSDNKKWSRENIAGTEIKNQRTYPAQEYESRDDLKFMVSYGEMKLTVVE